jgi:hypothetical protein
LSHSLGPNPAVLGRIGPITTRPRRYRILPISRYFRARRRHERHASHARARRCRTNRARLGDETRLVSRIGKEVPEFAGFASTEPIARIPPTCRNSASFESRDRTTEIVVSPVRVRGLAIREPPARRRFSCLQDRIQRYAQPIRGPSTQSSTQSAAGRAPTASSPQRRLPSSEREVASHRGDRRPHAPGSRRRGLCSDKPALTLTLTGALVLAAVGPRLTLPPATTGTRSPWPQRRVLCRARPRLPELSRPLTRSARVGVNSQPPLRVNSQPALTIRRLTARTPKSSCFTTAPARSASETDRQLPAATGSRLITLC